MLCYEYTNFPLKKETSEKNTQMHAYECIDIYEYMKYPVKLYQNNIQELDQ